MVLKQNLSFSNFDIGLHMKLSHDTQTTLKGQPSPICKVCVCLFWRVSLMCVAALHNCLLFGTKAEAVCMGKSREVYWCASYL